MTSLLLLLVEVVFASIMNFCRWWGSAAAEASYPRSAAPAPGTLVAAAVAPRSTPVKWNRVRPIPRFFGHGTPVARGWLPQLVGTEPPYTPLSGRV